MAVYTEVAFESAAALCERLGLGLLSALQGIGSGIENTNYRLRTTRGQFVLTLFERLTREQLPYYLHLMQHLAGHGLPVPRPQPGAAGALLHELAGKPAAIVSWLPGSPRLAPALSHCRQMGEMLGRLHVAAADFGGDQPHLRGLAWCRATAALVQPLLAPAQSALLAAETAFQQEVATSVAGAALPHGPIHADLFRDNVMFDDAAGEDRLSGLIDFYFAGTDALLFDIAVCLNDWCTDLDSGRLDEPRAAAFVASYERARALSHGERRLMPALLRAAALRFWLSRLVDRHLPRAATLLQPKDPAHFERVLQQRIARPWHP